MKTKLLTLVLCLIAFISFSQTNGWYQYHKPTQIINIDVDASGNIHLATDGGYIMYNTSTNMVEDYANLTSQNPPIGWCTSVKVNPANNNVALGLPSGQGIAVYDGANYTIYNSGNSDIGDFSSPQLHYTDSGMLYIYDKGDTKYQTFENGVFGTVQNLTFRPQAIIENEASTIVYFAGQTPSGFADGFYELDKATGTFTHYTTSNSGIIHNGVNCFFRDTNDLLYIGGHRGVNTLDAMGNWATYQEPLPINPSLFYSVYSIDKFSDGTFLVNNSKPNSSIENGFSTVDFSTNTWTHYDSSVYCNASDQVQNMILANDMVYTHFRKFGVPSEDNKLWSFDVSTNACVEKDINHLNVADLGLYGTSGLAMRQDPSEADRQNTNDVNTLEVLWINNGESSVNNMPLQVLPPIEEFADKETLFSADTPLDNIAVFDEHIMVGGQRAAWCHSNIGATSSFDYGLNDLDAFKTQFRGDPNDSESVGVIFGGWNNGNYEDYKAKIDLTNNTISTPEKFNYTSPNDGQTSSACFFDGVSGMRCFVSAQGNTGLIYTTEISWDFYGNNEPISLYEDDVSASNSFVPDQFRANGQQSLWFQGTSDNKIYIRDSDMSGNYQTYDVDFNNDGENDIIMQSNTYDDEEIVPIDFINSFFLGLSEYGGLRKRFSQAIIEREAPSGRSLNNTTETLNIEVFTESIIEDLPQDFYILDSFIYLYSDTHYATVISTTYGLLINTAIDYSSLVLNVDEVITNDDFKLYPNPANDIVSITDEKVISVKVFDINGRNVLVTKSNTFSVKHLSNGIYVVKVLGQDNRIMTKKLIKN